MKTNFKARVNVTVKASFDKVWDALALPVTRYGQQRSSKALAGKYTRRKNKGELRRKKEGGVGRYEEAGVSRH